MAAPKNAECAYLAPDDPAVQALVDIYGADRVVPSPLSVRLPAPLAHVALGVNSHILDDAASVGPLNDERVWRWLIGPPYPYAVEHSEAWTALQMAEAAKILDELRAGVRWTTGNPLHILRVEEEGGWRRIGACDIARSGFLDLAADEAKARREANNALPIGDPKIVWQPGFWLDPNFHARGVMTAAMRTLLAYTRLNVKYIDSNAFVGNFGSHRVHTRLGFRCKGVGVGVVKWPEVKGGGERRLYAFRLVLGGDHNDPFWSGEGTPCNACEAEKAKDAATVHPSS